MRKLRYLILPVLLCFCLLSGCTVEVQEEKKDDGSNQYYFYYASSDETKLVKEAYKPAQETAEFMIQDLVTRLNKGEHPGNGVSLLPKDVQINTYGIEGTELDLEFNNVYSQISRAREILVRDGVVRTFNQIPGITSVKIFVGKEELKDSKGKPIGAMSSTDFVELGSDDRESYRKDSFTLYFTDKTGEKLVEETRVVYYKRSLPKERVVLEQLAKGPMVKGHFPTIPENTEVLGISKSDRICYVNFNHVLVDYALDIPGKTTVYSVVNSLLASVDADKVQIVIEGKEDVSLRENTSLYSFFEWNESIIAAGEGEE